MNECVEKMTNYDNKPISIENLENYWETKNEEEIANKP